MWGRDAIIKDDGEKSHPTDGEFLSENENSAILTKNIMFYALNKPLPLVKGDNGWVRNFTCYEEIAWEKSPPGLAWRGFGGIL